MSVTPETWCTRDGHKHFECFVDFNEWLDDSDEAESLRDTYGLNNFSSPSKALFAGDKEAYDQSFKAYRDQKRREVLSADYILSKFGDDHWFIRNERRFDQLVERIKNETVVPFIGAGVSVSGGFPTWKDHLRKQGKTAGMETAAIEAHLAKGEYEIIIEAIETSRGADTYAQEIRDAFSKIGKLEAVILQITELFKKTLITTNYDRLLEQAFDISPGEEVQVINSRNTTAPRDPDKIAIIKLHGDVRSPASCILGKRQYDEAYGSTALDLARPIPKLLQIHYTTNNLLFIGCSLNNDRTVQVFKAVKVDQQAKGALDLPQHFSIEQAPETLAELENRNAALLNLGITPIWFPKGDFSKVEAILRHADNELKYQHTI